ncbi:hypothetical protein [Dongshaea marina]|uniref:hypothetical protein n=1 Tax=Dongshaea marina TaxID=2047966 RepID=UPI000D3E5E43|nr:hypothetical protein [Dongshaea marina]
MIQQQDLYVDGKLKDRNIEVNRALKEAYWFIHTSHQWSLDLSNGKHIDFTGTPKQLFDAVSHGDFHAQNVYSPWDMKSAFESEALDIIEQYPANYQVELPQFADDFKGWIQATNWAIKDAGPDVTYGWQENVWNAGSAHWVHNDYAQADVQSKMSTPTLALLKELGVYSGTYKPDFLVFDKYERDVIPDFVAAGWLWNGRDWNNYMTYVSQMSSGLENIPVMLWQLPGGHLQLMGDVDTRGTHASTAPDYFFGDSNILPDMSNLQGYIQQTPLTGGDYSCGDHAQTCTIDQYLALNHYNWGLVTWSRPGMPMCLLSCGAAAPQPVLATAQPMAQIVAGLKIK